MSDRRLLELAASAAKLRVVGSIDSCAGFCFGLWVRSPDRRQKYRWNPLINDGDALRLAVQLRLILSTFEKEAWAQRLSLTIKIPVESNPCDALRRAIVCAAAAIAESLMQEGGTA